MGCCEGENGLIKIKALEKYLPPNKFYNSFFFPPCNIQFRKGSEREEKSTVDMKKKFGQWKI